MKKKRNLRLSGVFEDELMLVMAGLSAVDSFRQFSALFSNFTLAFRAGSLFLPSSAAPAARSGNKCWKAEPAMGSRRFIGHGWQGGRVGGVNYRSSLAVGNDFPLGASSLRAAGPAFLLARTG